MKIKNWLLVLLIALCVAALYGYRTLDRMRTDTQPPEIVMDAQIPQISVADPKDALLQGITARDKKDGDVTSSLVVESIRLLDSTGHLMVKYAAFDSAGNVAKTQREAVYADYVPPKFTADAPLLYAYGYSFDVLSTVGATDVIDGEIQHRVRATSLGEGSLSEIGVHEIEFKVSNSLGDITTLVLPVEVYDSREYEASLSLSAYLVYLQQGANFKAASYLNQFTLMGEDVSLRGGLPANYTLKTKGTVDTQTPGVYPVEFRVTYTEKHETRPDLDREFTGYSKLIVVVEG